jgi:phospholipid transport system substrate-binding protein
MTRLMLLLGLWLVLAVPARAADALDYTRMTLEQARTIVSSSQSHNEKLAALSLLFGKFLDAAAMGRQALGRHWASFTPPQQQEFIGLFRELLERTFVQKLLLFENPNFVYVGEQPSGSESTVDTRIVTPRDQFDVAYTLRPSGDAWLATEIKVENVSLTANLANQLNRLLTKMSTDDLLELMRRKYGKGNSEAQP